MAGIERVNGKFFVINPAKGKKLNRRIRSLSNRAEDARRANALCGYNRTIFASLFVASSVILIDLCCFAAETEEKEHNIQALVNDVLEVVSSDLERLSQSHSWMTQYSSNFDEYRKELKADIDGALKRPASDYGNLRRIHLAVRFLTGQQTKFSKDETWAVVFPPPDFSGSLDLGINVDCYRTRLADAWFGGLSDLLSTPSDKRRRVYVDVMDSGKNFLNSNEFDGFYGSAKVETLSKIFQNCGRLVSENGEIGSVLRVRAQRLAVNDFAFEEWEPVQLAPDEILKTTSLFRDLARARYLWSMRARSDFASHEVRLAEGFARLAIGNLVRIGQIGSSQELGDAMLALEEWSKMTESSHESMSVPDVTSQDAVSWWNYVVCELGFYERVSDRPISEVNLYREQLTQCFEFLNFVEESNKCSGASDARQRVVSEVTLAWKSMCKSLQSKAKVH